MVSQSSACASKAGAVATIANLGILCDMVAAETGISVLSHYICENRLRDGSLIVAHIPERPFINTLLLVWRKEALRTSRIAFARDLCADVLKTEPSD